MSLSSATSSATSQLPYLQSLYQSGLLSLGSAAQGSTTASAASSGTSSGTTAGTVVQISDQALALQDSATLLGSATGAGTDLQQTLQQLDALALQASGQGGNTGLQALADASSAALGLSDSSSQSLQNTDLAGASTLLGTVGVDTGSLADLSTAYQNQLSLSDLGLAGSTGTAASGAGATSTSTTSSNPTQQALSLYQTLQQQGLAQLLGTA